jgi:hypothetical protein
MSPIVILLLIIFKSTTTATTTDIMTNQAVSRIIINNNFNGNNYNTNTTQQQQRSISNYDLNYSILKNSNKFPLENAFKVSVYRLNINSSSSCNYTGKERLIKCHKVFLFDSIQYQNAIKEARNLILSRIGLRHEPSNVNMSRNTIKLLGGINKKFEGSTKTQFDKQELHGRTVKIMRELTGKFTVVRQPITVNIR